MERAQAALVHWHHRPTHHPDYPGEVHLVPRRKNQRPALPFCSAWFICGTNTIGHVVNSLQVETAPPPKKF